MSCSACGVISNLDVAGVSCWRCNHEFTDEELAELNIVPDEAAQPTVQPNVGSGLSSIIEVSAGIVGAAVFIVPMILLLSWCTSRPDKSEADYAREAAVMAEAQKLGQHCLSAWDGSHPSVVEAVKRSLRDPNSFEHVETRVSPVNTDGKNLLMMQFRAKNGFGGMNVGMAEATMNNATCAVTVQKIAS